jgi:hypothetical protein
MPHMESMRQLTTQCKHGQCQEVLAFETLRRFLFSMSDFWRPPLLLLPVIKPNQLTLRFSSDSELCAFALICDKVDGGHLASCHWFKLATHATLVVMARWGARKPFPLRKLLQ